MADDNGAAASGGNSEQNAQADNLIDAAKQAADGTAKEGQVTGDSGQQSGDQGKQPTEGFLNGKYKTREEFEKGYNELRKAETELRAKLKSYAGAPENYELSMPDDLKDQLEWRSDDPLLSDFQKGAKERGMTQETVSWLLGLLAKYEYSNVNPDWEREAAALGERGTERLKDFEDWYGANLSDEDSMLVKVALGVNPSPSDIFKALEAVRNAGRQPAGLNNPDETVASSMTVEEINKKYRTPDPNTKRALIDTPEGRAAYRAELARVVGSGDHKVIVGGARKAS